MSTNIKQAHEIESCRRFLSIYNYKTGKKIDFLKQGSANNKEPDCICSDEIAIELVGAYDNESQAEKIWASARGTKTYKRTDFLLLTFNNLQSEIGKKLQKLGGGNYDGFTGKIILVCNLHSPLLHDKEVASYIESYSPFREDSFFDRYFYEIWVSWTSEVDGNLKIAKLE